VSDNNNNNKTMSDEPTDYGIPPLAPLDSSDDEFSPPVQHPKRSRKVSLPGLDEENGNQTTEEDLKLNGILNSEEYTGSTFNIQRRDEMGKYAFLMTIPISDWSEDTKRIIADKYGGGEYKVRVRKAGGGTYGRTFNFSIDPAVKPKGFENSGNGQGNSLDLIRQAKLLTGDSTPMMMQMMQAQQAQSMQFMQMMQAQSAENMKALVAIMARPAAAAPAGNERIIELLLTKALTPPAPPPPPMDIDKMISVVAKLRELTDNGGNDERPVREEKSDFFSDVMRALPSILKSFAAIRLPHPPQQQIEQPQQPQQSAPPSAPAPVAAPNPPAPADVAEVNKAALGQFLPQLVSAAEEDSNTDDFAALIDGAMDDDQFDGIITLLERDDWFAVLADAHPPVMKWSNWFTRLRISLLKLAEDGEDDSPIEVETVTAAE